MDTRSRQLVLDIWLDQPLTEEVIEKVLEIISSATTVLKKYDYEYRPKDTTPSSTSARKGGQTMGGRTIVFILSESHFVFHSYPENNYFLIDLYVCDLTIDLEEIASKIVDSLQVKVKKQEIHVRGVPGTLIAQD
jgi:S-adenosylmethionine/arginine decarboxylase-like enzyme